MKKHKFHLKLTDNQTNEVHECDADVLIVNMAVKNPNNPLLQSESPQLRCNISGHKWKS